VILALLIIFVVADPLSTDEWRDTDFRCCSTGLGKVLIKGRASSAARRLPCRATVGVLPANLSRGGFGHDRRIGRTEIRS
jgi:hypothetical protein